MNVTIRQASSKDAAEIAITHVASWHETYAERVPPAMLSSLSVEVRTAMWKKAITAPDSSDLSSVYVAVIDRKVVGFGSCGARRTEALRAKGYDGEINAIYIRKAFQRLAIGTKLLHAMASDLSLNSYAAAGLWVLQDNAPARQFYEWYGGEVVSEREDRRPDGILVEAGYGWVDLGRLVRLTAPSSARA